MIRSARQVRPVCDQLDTKTLLSAGVIGQAPSREAAEFARGESVSRDYIGVQTSGFKATDVTWILQGQRRVGGPLVELERGRVANLSADTVHVVNTTVPRSSIAGEFVFKYKDGNKRGTAQGIGVVWDGKGTKPSVPTHTLPPPGLPGTCPTWYYFAELENETGNDSLDVDWTWNGANMSMPLVPPAGSNYIIIQFGFDATMSSQPPSFVFTITNGTQYNPYTDSGTASSSNINIIPDNMSPFPITQSPS